MEIVTPEKLFHFLLSVYIHRLIKERTLNTHTQTHKHIHQPPQTPALKLNGSTSSNIDYWLLIGTLIFLITEQCSFFLLPFFLPAASAEVAVIVTVTAATPRFCMIFNQIYFHRIFHKTLCKIDWFLVSFVDDKSTNRIHKHTHTHLLFCVCETVAKINLKVTLFR